MTMLSFALAGSGLRSPADLTDLVVADRRIAGLSWSAYRSSYEIAYRVGYEYPANLSCAFKRYYGCSPRQWKHT